MKKVYLHKMLLAMALVLASTGAKAQQTVIADFNAANSEWATANSSTSSIADGHLTCTMAVQTSGKYRGDLQYKAAGDGISLTPSKDKVLAIKFIGSRPDGKLKMEMNDGTNWYNKKWNGGSPSSVVTSNGNYIYYFTLTDDATYTGETPITIKQLNLIVADAAAEPYSYTVDWVATFSSTDDLTTAETWKDDGSDDADDALAVSNKTTGKEYGSLNDAVTAADDGDEIVINVDITLSSRITLNGKDADARAITISDGGNGASIKLSKDDLLVLVANSGNKVTFNGVTFDGGSSIVKASYFEASSSGEMVFDGVKVKNCLTTKNQGVLCVKSYGTMTIKNCEFDNCIASSDGTQTGTQYGVIFNGTSKVTLSGNNTFNNVCQPVRNEKANTLTADNVSNGTAINIVVDDANLTAGNIVVKGCDDASKFHVIASDDKWALEAKDGNLVLNDGTGTGITETAVTSSKAYGSDGMIVVETMGAKQVNVYDMSGRCVKTVMLKGGSNVIQMQNGMYIVDKTKVVVR